MTSTIKTIHPIDLKKTDEASFARRCVGCIVLTFDNKILLQQRDNDCRTFPGCLATFGGGIEAGESPMQALVRELHEELGAKLVPRDVISLGALTDAHTQHRELIYSYFWHDKHHTITGCYEGEAKEYKDCASALKHPKIMDDVRWLLYLCRTSGIIA